MSQRDFDDPLYAQFVRICHVVSAPKRLDLLDLLAQGEKAVETLAEKSATPVANMSAHLRVLRRERLVETRGEGSYVFYRLADDDVLRSLRSLQALGRSRRAEVEQVASLYLDGRDEFESVDLA